MASLLRAYRCVRRPDDRGRSTLMERLGQPVCLSVAGHGMVDCFCSVTSSPPPCSSPCSVAPNAAPSAGSCAARQPIVSTRTALSPRGELTDQQMRTWRRQISSNVLTLTHISPSLKPLLSISATPRTSRTRPRSSILSSPGGTNDPHDPPPSSSQPAPRISTRMHDIAGALFFPLLRLCLGHSPWSDKPPAAKPTSSSAPKAGPNRNRQHGGDQGDRRARGEAHPPLGA